MKGMKKEEVEESPKMVEQVAEEEDWVEPVGGMEGAHRPGRNPKRGRRLRLRASEQEVHVLVCKWCRDPVLHGGMKRLGYMESLPIVPIAHSSYIGPVGDWDLKT
jgi:hypothetical protein